MFIPIDAKADITGSKKGKLTPAQHAQLNAWCLAEKTGILDCLDKCEATAMFYSATNNIATVVFKKGYFVICGRLVECEAGTEVQVVTPASGSVSGRIIARYNLASSGEEEFIITTTTSNLVQQDLNNNPLTGVYEFELYSYTATPTLVTLTRNASYVPDIGGKLSQFEASLKDEGKPLHGYDDTKGTIEERLTTLGFNEGTITATSSNSGTIVIVPNSSFIRQLGKVIYGKLTISIVKNYIINEKKIVGTFSSVQNINNEKEIIRYSLETINSITDDKKTSNIIISIKDKSVLLSTTQGENVHFRGNLVFSFVIDLYKNDVITSNAGTYPIYS